jgi:hypothetical protein
VGGRGEADGRGCHRDQHRDPQKEPSNPQKEPSHCPTHLPPACPYHPTTQCSLSNYNDVAARPPAGQQDQLNFSNCQLRLLRSTVVLQDFPLTFSELVAPVNLVSVSCRAAGSVRTAHQFRGRASLALPNTQFKCCLEDKVRAQQRISVCGVPYIDVRRARAKKRESRDRLRPGSFEPSHDLLSRPLLLAAHDR